MGFIITLTGALSLWIVLWAIGTKPDDAGIVALTIVLVGVAVRILSQYLRSDRGN
ncbi:MAG TPA: hypothetical protein VMA83_05060 [Solirubrobacteraceae bacterium]|nr:hypothetical protein [Solirubrobacteraceae bacterium]